jgi:hypothetical protein
MAKNAISVTLDTDNLTWLKARAGSGQARSVSDLLDRIITDARTRGTGGGVKSVVGTIDVDPADPLLLKADEAIAALFTESLGRPLVVKEKRATYRPADRKGPRRAETARRRG